MTTQEKIDWLKDAKRTIAHYVTSHVCDRWSEFLEAFDDIGLVYTEADDTGDTELTDAYHTMLKELESELNTLAFINI